MPTQIHPAVYVIAYIAINSLLIGAEKSYMDSLYENMLRAQETLKDVASNVNVGLKSIAKSLKFIEKFVDSTIEEDCDFRCKVDEVPFPRENHVPTVNGCGSLGLHLSEDELPFPEMADCCDAHDVCYDTCGSDKEDCDRQFKRCLYSICDSNKDQIDLVHFKICQGGAKLLYTGTMALGCSSFKEAQSSACVCKSIKVKPKSKEL